jgi:uncharacterized protein (TIGR02301 family)
MRSAALIALASLALTAQAPARGGQVSSLAFTLGQSHGLRQLCHGETDQYWRNRMEAMLRLEAADEAAREPLTVRFNDGFRDARGHQARCNDLSRLAERAAAARGKALAQTLARTP